MRGPPHPFRTATPPPEGRFDSSLRTSRSRSERYRRGRGLSPAKSIYGGDLVPPAKVMKAHLVPIEGMRFRAKADDGHEILFDGGEAESRRGPSPVQATLLATMACTASDVVSILRKERVPFRALAIEAEAERAKEVPRVFTKIHLHYRVRGDHIPEAAVKRAIDLSSEKYCTVGIMLRRAGVEFVNTHEILPME